MILRCMIGLLLCLAAATPLAAQTIDGRKISHKQLLEIEEHLIWTGHLDAEVDEVSPGDLRDALQSFKLSLAPPALPTPTGAPATPDATPGTPPPAPVLVPAQGPVDLTAAEGARLADEAAAVRTRVGFTRVKEVHSGLTVGVPTALFAGGTTQKITTPYDTGLEWISADKSIRMYVMRTAQGGETVASWRNRFPWQRLNVQIRWEESSADRLTVEGTQGPTPQVRSEGFYMTVFQRGSELIAFRIVFNLRHETEVRRISNAIASWFPRDNLHEFVYMNDCGPLPPPGPEATTVRVVFGTDRRRATTGTGFDAELGGQLAVGCADVSVPARPPGGTTAVAKSATLTRITTLKQGGRMRFINEGTELDENRALLFVHGYNVPFDEAITRAGQLAVDTGYPGLIYAYSWPTRASVFDYITDLDRAEQSEPYLEQFMATIMRAQRPPREYGRGTPKLDIVVHSMGSQLVLRAARGTQGALDLKKRFGQVILNPAVGRDRPTSA